MSVEGLVALAVVYFVLNLVQRAKRAAGKREDASTAPPRQSAPRQRSRVSVTAAGRTDPTQATAQRLERFLRHMQGLQEVEEEPKPVPAMARAPATKLPQKDRGPMGRQSRVSLPSAKEVEERTSLEAQGERQPFDHDESAEAVVKRRIEEVEKRDYETAAEGHSAFDQRIKSEAADQTRVVPRFTMQQMRDAFVWREILGPPVGMRDEIT